MHAMVSYPMFTVVNLVYWYNGMMRAAAFVLVSKSTLMASSFLGGAPLRERIISTMRSRAAVIWIAVVTCLASIKQVEGQAQVVGFEGQENIIDVPIAVSTRPIAIVILC